MTLKEFYDTIGSDYNSALLRMGNSERILDKFVRKFPADKTAEQLFEAYESEDYETAFRMAHTLKGLCSNLGLDKLQKLSSELTEALRGGVADNAPELLEKVREEHGAVISALEQLS
ncbi:MAG: Hpt domain-containing protein [Oscillospiraceae bacterium]|nr:Hpt domain-containing protein [Oscillospiraceae bacterium]